MQNENMEDMFTKTQELFDAVNPTVLNHVAHTRRQFRERAINILIQSLDPKEQSDNDTFQKIPLEFLRR